MKISNRERDTILAALRHWQSSKRHASVLIEMTSNAGEPLTQTEIDALCDRVNVDHDADQQTAPQETK